MGFIASSIEFLSSLSVYQTTFVVIALAGLYQLGIYF